MLTAREYASKYRLWDLNVLPIGNRSKKPVIDSWAYLQKMKASDAELANWFGNNSTNIGVICGGISGNLVVIDYEKEQIDLYHKFCSDWEKREGKSIWEMTPVAQTGGDGYHIYVKIRHKPQLFHPKDKERDYFPDIQSEGCYVVAPPSIHPGGKPYVFINPEVDTIHVVESLDVLGIHVPKRPAGAIKAEGKTIAEGSRNNTLASYAGAWRRTGMEQEDIEEGLLKINARRCQPPLADADVLDIARSVSRYAPHPTPPHTGGYIDGEPVGIDTKRDKNVTDFVTKNVTATGKTMSRFDGLSTRIRTWVEGTTGWWETRELDAELGIAGSTDKENRRQIIHRLRDEGVIEKHAKINKQFRYVDTTAATLAFKAASDNAILPIKWPLGIEKYVNIFPGNMAVLAGYINAGKTAFMLDFIHKNQHSFDICYFCSEMHSEELRNRLKMFPAMDIEDWQFDAFERSADFADVIRPNCINLIDYMEMTTELYNVNFYLTAIANKLKNGIAIIALQKKKGQELGRGQEFGSEKPKLYLSMDKGRLSIIKGKSWVNENVNPDGLRVSFNIRRGCAFDKVGEWTR